MARRVFLHVGTAKSGTTVLQNRLWENREVVRRAGLRYPGLRPDSHYLATLDLLRLDYAGYPNPLAAGAWPRLAAEVAATPGDALISHELLARADPDQVARALADLAPAEVHLLVTVRHLARQIASSWQENVRNTRPETWEQFSAAVTGAPGADPGTAEFFWIYQDYPAYLARWAATVPPERVHVVGLVPGGDLWADVARVLGVDPGLATRPATTLPNTSLGWEQTELLRLVNVRLADRVDFREYDLAVKSALAMEVLSVQPPTTPTRLTPEAFAVAEARHVAQIEAVRAAGYDVDPRIDTLDGGTAARPDPEATARVEAGLVVGADALAGYVLAMVEQHYRVQPLRKLRAAAVDLTETSAAARRALHVYLRLRSVAERRAMLRRA